MFIGDLGEEKGLDCHGFTSNQDYSKKEKT